MFRRIGKKLKIMGVVLFWVLFLGGMTDAVVSIIRAETFHPVRFFGITVAVLLLAALVRLFVCGFGIIVEAYENRLQEDMTKKPL